MREGGEDDSGGVEGGVGRNYESTSRKRKGWRKKMTEIWMEGEENERGEEDESGRTRINCSQDVMTV